jgi:hypothetical protein
MTNENKVIFYSEELNEDIYQNKKLLHSKKIILEDNEKEAINEDSYNTIIETKDYMGCINNNCSTIKPDCSNEKNNINSSNNNNNNNNNISTGAIEGNINNYISNLIDFLFILLLVGLLIFIIYKRESLYLIYVLGITLLYIFIKFLMLSNF